MTTRSCDPHPQRDLHVQGSSAVTFAAVSVDDESPPDRGRWRDVTMAHLPSASIHMLGVAVAPSRLLLDDKRRVLRWWDGTHGLVLRGNHGKSRSNGSHDLLGTLIDLL